MSTARLFFGEQSACQSFCRGRLGFYVYVLRRPDGRPFYVGKGSGDRVFQHENEARHPNGRKSNSHKLNIIRSLWRNQERLIYEIDSWHEDEQSAYDRELALIQTLKRLHEGGPLTNRAVGGGVVADRSPFSIARHSATLSGAPLDNPERTTLNRYVLSIGPMESVVIKPINQVSIRPTQRYPSKTICLRLRSAVAIAAAAAASGSVLADGVRIPRRVVVDGVEGIVENGVANDLLTAGVVNVLAARDPADEWLVLRPGAASRIVGLVGTRKCVELGIWDPKPAR